MDFIQLADFYKIEETDCYFPVLPVPFCFTLIPESVGNPDTYELHLKKEFMNYG